MEGGGKLRPTRYAHFEGHTDLSYTSDGRYVVTCGSDGEVRVFEGLDDDDCKTHVVADCAYAVATRQDTFLLATDSNLVQAFTLEEGSPCQVVTRFTAHATHIVVSADGNIVACAGSDMTARVQDMRSGRDTVFRGHAGPVLSVALDPKGKFVASSSCDGSVRVWDMLGSEKVSWGVLPTSNTPAVTHPLCRLSFTPGGDTLAVPVGMKVLLYDREGWRADGELSCSAIKKAISVIAVSPCGTLLAAGTLDGTLVAWTLSSRIAIMTLKHPKGLAISALACNPKNLREIAFADINGHFGTVVDVGVGVTQEQTPVTAGVENGDVAGDCGGGSTTPAAVEAGEEEEEEEDEFSISKIKADLGFADDAEGTFLGLPDAERDTPGVTAGQEESRPATPAAPRGGVGGGVRLPEVQKPFQPGMSPEHLTERYMVWSSAGVVRQYCGDDESTIDVEFHDTATHHALHLSNTQGYTIAALSTSVLALAAPATDTQPSKLSVHQLQNNKEWQTDIQTDIQALAVGLEWVAVATSGRILHIFGSCGTQRELLSLPGPAVCLAGCGALLMVVCHAGVGVSGDQHMTVAVLDLRKGRHPLPQPCPLPLGPQCYLAWAGFTDQGTPMAADSGGVVRLLNTRAKGQWTPILNTREQLRGKSDHYFVVGGSEAEGGSVRCILCRGARYPPTLPRPHLSLLTMKLPVCEGTTDKGELEERVCRMRLLLPPPPTGRPGAVGSAREREREEATRIIQEAMIKLFALSCRSERECRAVEVCRLMPDCTTVQLAIKYAAKLRRLPLAEKLGEVAALMEEEEEEEVEEEVRNPLPRRRGGRGRGGWTQEEEEEEEVEEEDLPSLSSAMEEEEEEEEREEAKERKSNPFLQAPRRRPTTAITASLSQKNPFKKTNTPLPLPLFSSSSSSCGLRVMGSFRKAGKKLEVRKSQKFAPQDTKSLKNRGKENIQTPSENAPPRPASPTHRPEELSAGAEKTPAPAPAPPATPKARSALELWLSDNIEVVSAANPGVDKKDLLVKAAPMFMKLEGGVKQKYKSLAEMERKRTREEEEEEEEEVKKKKKKEEEEEEEKKKKKKKEEEEEKKKKGGSGLNKLSSFVFKKCD